MCSMFGVDVVYVFHVCVPCLVLMLCICSIYVFHVCVPCMCSMFGVDVVNVFLHVFHVWC